LKSRLRVAGAHSGGPSLAFATENGNEIVTVHGPREAVPEQLATFSGPFGKSEESCGWPGEKHHRGTEKHRGGRRRMDVSTRFSFSCLSLCTSVHLCASVVRSPQPNRSDVTFWRVLVAAMPRWDPSLLPPGATAPRSGGFRMTRLNILRCGPNTTLVTHSDHRMVRSWPSVAIS
jgi:hypothetical protein